MAVPEKQLATVWLVVAIVIAMVAACGQSQETHDGSVAPGRGVYVPASWQTTREISGHRVHVLDERVACTRCHAMTGTSIGGVVPSKCAACHEKESRIEHARDQASERFGADARADCTVCHGFSLDGTGHPAGDATGGDVPAPTECRRCHETQQGETPAVQVHGTSDCVQCHRPHDDDRPKPGACDGCHAEVHTEHAAEGESSVETCTACHEHQHGPASAALGTCVTCHAAHEPIVPATALFAGGHTECVGCHRPHAFEKGAATPCRSCHEDVHVLGAARSRAHAQCESCHAPHDVSGSPARACATCHTSVHPDHPATGAAGTCVGCHDPHPTGKHAGDRVRSCSACHQVAASDKAFHGSVPCAECHAPHDFALEHGTREPCRACHQRELSLATTVAGHASCEGCHRGLPHRPAQLGVACAACHEGVHDVARPGHAACTDCHEPHAGALVKECRNCHAGEHRSAPRAHQRCTQCHEEHSGAAPADACATCHAEQAASPHGRISADCASCHRPHGPKGVQRPPPCGTCHASGDLAGLHGQRKHQDCARCHGEHGSVQPVYRGECLSCHADRVGHFPDAPTCTSCHLFGPVQ